MRKWIVGVLVLLLCSALHAASGKDIAAQLGLSAASKAMKQWEGIFEKPEKMAKMGIDKLSDADKAELKAYLIGHAADSDHPEAAGL